MSGRGYVLCVHFINSRSLFFFLSSPSLSHSLSSFAHRIDVKTGEGLTMRKGDCVGTKSLSFSFSFFFPVIPFCFFFLFFLSCSFFLFLLFQRAFSSFSLRKEKKQRIHTVVVKENKVFVKLTSKVRFHSFLFFVPSLLSTSSSQGKLCL